MFFKYARITLHVIVANIVLSHGILHCDLLASNLLHQRSWPFANPRRSTAKHPRSWSNNRATISRLGDGQDWPRQRGFAEFRSLWAKLLRDLAAITKLWRARSVRSSTRTPRGDNLGSDTCNEQVSRWDTGTPVCNGDILACCRTALGTLLPCCCRTRRILTKHAWTTGTRKLCHQHMLVWSFISCIKSFAIRSKVLCARELQTVGEVVEVQRGNVQSVAVGGKTDRMYSRSDLISRNDRRGPPDRRLLYNTDTLVYLLCFI